jgi:RNA polymerase sigma-70 factor (ECF subfamily)
MKGGNAKQFLMLFDAFFDEVYRYVARRVDNPADIRKISRLTFLDALGQIQGTPEDCAYLTWLYSLAFPRVSENIAKASFPVKTGFVSAEDLEKRSAEDGDVIGMTEKVMKKMTMEEREIVRLKFFEQVSDGDVMTVLGLSEETVGIKIYRVLKRLHFLLFGDSKLKTGVYFGDVSGLFEKARTLENIEIQDIFKLELRTTISNKIDRQDLAIDAEVVAEKEVRGAEKDILSVGSDDPAKIFVKASQEMTAEDWADLEREKQEKIRKIEEAEVKAEEAEMAYAKDVVEGEGGEEVEDAGQDYENLMDVLERWKGVLVGVPIFLFFVVGVFVVLNIFVFNGKIERGYPTICVAAKAGVVDFSGGILGGILPSNNPVSGDGEFYDAERRAITSQIVDRACGAFDVESLVVKKVNDTTLQVNVAVKDWKMEYKFVKNDEQWRIKKFLKTYEAKISARGNDESREV